MSFAHYARKVRDEARGPWMRLASLRSCVSTLCWMTGRPYRATLEWFGIDPARMTVPPGVAFLLGTLARVEAERDAYMAARGAFDAARRETKRAGGRQLSNAERQALARLAAPADTLPRAEEAG